jgi:DNA-binding transcriptional LysR family regulator
LPRRKGAAGARPGRRRQADWIAPDDALPEHPSVVWRKRQHPKVEPRYRVNSILSVLELVALGLGVGVLPLFLAAERRDVVALSEPLESARTDLWLLAHPESRPPSSRRGGVRAPRRGRSAFPEAVPARRGEQASQ